MTTVAFKNGNILMNMCMCMYMCFATPISDLLSVKDKRCAA